MDCVQKIYTKNIHVHVNNYSPRTRCGCFIKVDDETFYEVFDAKINSIYNNDSNIELNHLYINRIKEKYNAKMKVGDILEICFKECNRNKCPLEYIKSWGKLQFENTCYFNTIVCNTFDVPIYIHLGRFDPSKIINQKDIKKHISSREVHYSFHNVKEKHVFIDYSMRGYEDFIELFEKALNTLLEMVIHNDSVLLTMEKYKRIVMHEIEEYSITSVFATLTLLPTIKNEIQIGLENEDNGDSIYAQPTQTFFHSPHIFQKIDPSKNSTPRKTTKNSSKIDFHFQQKNSSKYSTPRVSKA